MKKLPVLLLTFLCLNQILVAQSYFTIQVGSFMDAQPQDFTALQPLGFVHAVKTNVNLSLVYVGGFENRAAAEKVWQQVRAKGYINAFIQERVPQEGQIVSTIQLATKNAKKPINWGEYAKVQDLYASISGDNVKILTAMFVNAGAAKPTLDALKKAGFKDAFVKNMNTIFLHKLTKFETNLKEPLIPLELNYTPPTVNNNVPPSYDQQTTMPPIYNQEPRIVSPNTTLTPRGTATARKVAAPTMPKLHTDVKRSSALNLQKLLKTEGYYKGSLDGFYGKGTADAYTAMKTGNRELQKYVVLAGQMEGKGASTSRLQTAINTLPDDPSAMTTIIGSTTPVAKAYQAYNLFITNGVSNEVNRLMNTAVKEAFTAKKLAKQPPFDYRSTYAYNDLAQLLLHLHYIHSAPGNTIMAPCWLYQRHPKEMASVFERYAAVASLDFPLKACDQFLNWEEVRLLHTIAADLNTDKKLDTEELAQAASLRSMLYVSPRPIAASDVKDTESWSAKMLTGLDNWATRDAGNQQTVTAFKAAYFQSQARLEDFYLDKGFKAEAAKSLALVTLRTLVEYHLERFV